MEARGNAVLDYRATAVAVDLLFTESRKFPLDQDLWKFKYRNISYKIG